MKKSKWMMVAAFVLASGIGLLSKANPKTLLNSQGYGTADCALHDLNQQNKNCAVQPGTACTIMGNQAFNSEANCRDGLVGQLNYTN